MDQQQQQRKRKREINSGSTNGSAGIPIPSFSSSNTDNATRTTTKPQSRHQNHHYYSSKKRKKNEILKASARRKLTLPTPPPPSSSFSAPTSSSSSLPLLSSSQRRREDAATTTPLSILLQVEAALNLSLLSTRHHHGGGGRRGKTMVSVTQFYNIVNHLSSTSPPVNTNNTIKKKEEEMEKPTSGSSSSESTLNEEEEKHKKKQHPNSNPPLLQQLSNPQRILYDLLRIASPELYRLSSSSNNGDGDADDDEQGKNPLQPLRSTTNIEIIKHDTYNNKNYTNKVVGQVSSRMEQLQKLYKLRAHGKKRHFVEARILSCIWRQEKQKTFADLSTEKEETKEELVAKPIPASPPSISSKTNNFETPTAVGSTSVSLQKKQEEETATPWHHNNNNAKSTSLLLEPYITPNMTLQQRVEARAKFRQERMELATTRKQKLNNDDNEVQTTDKMVLLQAADALRSMVRQKSSVRSVALKGIVVVGRQGGSGGALKKSKSLQEKSKEVKKKVAKHTIMSIAEILKNLNNGAGGVISFSQKSKGGSASTIPSSQTMIRLNQKKRASTTTKKEVLAILQDLALVVPEWIRLQEKNKDSKNDRKREAYVVVIRNDVDYQSVRSKLGGRSLQSFPKKEKNNSLILSENSTGDDGNTLTSREENERKARVFGHGSNQEVSFPKKEGVVTMTKNVSSSSSSSISTPKRKNALRTLVDRKTTSSYSSSAAPQQPKSQSATTSGSSTKISLEPEEEDDDVNRKRFHSNNSKLSSSSIASTSSGVKSSTAGVVTSNHRAQIMMLSAGGKAVKERDSFSSALSSSTTAKRKLNIGKQETREKGQRRKKAKGG